MRVSNANINDESAYPQHRVDAEGDNMLSRLAAMIICVHLLAFASVAGEPETSSISQGTTQAQNGLATIPVLVLDRHRNPLTDLNQNELELYEGKEEQVIESLSRDREAPATIGFLIDQSNSVRGSFPQLRLRDDPNPAEGLLRTGDHAFVAMFAERSTLVCPLISDLGEINKAIHSVMTAHPPGGATSLYDAIFWACGELSTQSGRKALIILSDMQDSSSQHTREEATALAQRSGTVVYPIRAGTSPGAAWEFRRERVCQLIASGTGGVPFAVYPNEALSAAFRRIRADLDSTYVIAYRPKSQGRVSIKIRCTRKGVRIVAPDWRY